MEYIDNGYAKKNRNKLKIIILLILLIVIAGCAFIIVEYSRASKQPKNGVLVQNDVNGVKYYE